MQGMGLGGVKAARGHSPLAWQRYDKWSGKRPSAYGESHKKPCFHLTAPHLLCIFAPMKAWLRLFRVRSDERWLALGALFYGLSLNAMVIRCYAGAFTELSDAYHRLFVRTFHVSGFDPLTYEVVSSWATPYNIYRHPLLAFFMYLPNQVNQVCIHLTGLNCVQFVVGALLTFCCVYSSLFLYRILRELVGLGRADGVLLTALCFGFAMVMVSSSVPDHFALSMFMLLLTLYVAGLKMKHGRPLTRLQTVVLFFLTAGVSLNNGIKVFLAALFANGRRLFRPSYLLPAVLLPSLLLWGAARWEWNYFEKPRFKARQEARRQKAEQRRQRLFAEFRDTTRLRDSVAVVAALRQLAQREKARRQAAADRLHRRQGQGEPIAKGEFAQWTDISTPRLPAIVENWFGETLMLHPDHLLGDVLRGRPAIVTYRSPLNYCIEAVVVGLFLAGVWAGRRARFMWLALSFFGFDAFIHLVLGFGLNEVYIMGAHWLFVLPIVIGSLFRACRRRKGLLRGLRLLVFSLSLFLYGWNLWLYGRYLLGG